MVDYRQIAIVWAGSVVLILALAGLVHLVAYICKIVKAKKNEKYTNYSRIKEMSIFEVADLLWDLPFMWETYEDVVKWLCSEVQSNDGI